MGGWWILQLIEQRFHKSNDFLYGWGRFFFTNNNLHRHRSDDICQYLDSTMIHHTVAVAEALLRMVKGRKGERHPGFTFLPSVMTVAETELYTILLFYSHKPIIHVAERKRTVYHHQRLFVHLRCLWCVLPAEMMKTVILATLHVLWDGWMNRCLLW